MMHAVIAALVATFGSIMALHSIGFAMDQSLFRKHTRLAILLVWLTIFCGIEYLLYW